MEDILGDRVFLCVRQKVTVSIDCWFIQGACFTVSIDCWFIQGAIARQRSI